METTKLDGSWTDPTLGRVLFGDWLTEWQRTTTNRRPTTEVRDDSIIRTHVRPRFGGVPLAAIGQRDVRAWVAELAARRLAPTTVRKVYQVFSKVMAAAVDAGMIARSPCRNVPLPKVDHKEMRFLTPAEVARLARTIDQGYRALVLVAAYGGLRVGELAGLRRRDLDLTRYTVEVTEVVTEPRGRLHVGPPKTRAGRRTIRLPRFVVAVLADHLEAPGWLDEFVFTSQRGRPFRPTNFRARTWRPAVQAAGLDGLRVHDLRHTAVALWIAAGANPKQVSVRAGHTSVSFTLDRYGHLYPESDAILCEQLDARYACSWDASA